MPEDTRPRWAVNLQDERERRGWSKHEMARRLHQAAGTRYPPVVNLARQILGWEKGEHFPRAWQAAYVTAFDTTQEKLFGVDGLTPLPADDAIELIEFMRRAEASDLGAGTLDVVYAAVDRLCRDYPTMPALRLRDRCKATMRHVLGLLDGRTTLAQHRELLVSAGWMAALLGCVYFDLGDRAAAENARRVALQLGEQAGHGEVVGWAWEMAAWFALVEGRYPDVVTAAQAGRRRSGVTSAGVQLALQEAKGLARMGDGAATEALEAGGKLMRALPVPQHPEHHFVFDHTKYEFYAATIYTWLEQDDAAEEHAHEVVGQCEQPTGVRWPMRLADTRIDLGLIAGRRGDLEGAIHYGRAAFEFERRSASLLSRAGDLVVDLSTRYPDAAIVDEYRDQLIGERCALPPPDRGSPLG